MPDPSLIQQWKHTHIFDTGNPLAEKRTLWALALTGVMMVAEIIGGYIFNSMALLADGWHMSSHALALSLSLLSYIFARKYSNDTRFTFGTWKIEILAGYTSAILLVLVAGLMLFHSVEKLISPAPIQHNEALTIATLGLLINLICAWLLKETHTPHHQHDIHEHAHHHEDLNLRSAYIHVITDAATSALAIIALIASKFWAADWLDPAIGIIGAGLVTIWAYRLLRDTAYVLLDAEMQSPIVAEIRAVIGSSPTPAVISDLHVWRVGKGKYACILSLVVSGNVSPDYFRQQLSVHEELVHITIEVNRYIFPKIE